MEQRAAKFNCLTALRKAAPRGRGSRTRSIQRKTPIS
jgi:hypothetical protein